MKKLKFQAKENDKDRFVKLTLEGMRTMGAIVSHPVTLLIGGFVLIDYLESHYWDPCCRTNEILGPISANALRTGLITGAVVGAVRGD